jgi:hypothetical protein
LEGVLKADPETILLEHILQFVFLVQLPQHVGGFNELCLADFKYLRFVSLLP